MRISWKWLSEMVDLGPVGSPERLADLLTRRGLEVEAIERQSQGFDRVVTARILERAPHPQADRLSLCRVSLGEGEPLEIVCGARNMKEGDIVALARVGAHLPNGMRIEKSRIRGVVSNGMLCSEQELGLGESSEGILILPPTTPPGKPLASLLGRDDTILTFKLTANRGDCLSHYGMAREVAAALGTGARRPEARALPTDRGSGPITVALDAGEKCPQFLGVFIEGVKIGPSPGWVVKRLDALGSRSINNVVDATNLVMLELGQPVHAYDADRIEGGRLRVTFGARDVEFPLLDGKSVILDGSELVIADARKPVGLAGVMGGGNSEVLEKTTRIFLECAEFDPALVRQAASRHQRKTDAAHRFERGVDPAGVSHAIARLATLVQDFAGGEIRGVVSCRRPSREKPTPREIVVSFPYFEDFLGMPLESAEAETILTGLGCQVRKEDAGRWRVGIPSWRQDLGLKQDLAEEIARSVGYDRIRETVPKLTTSPASTWESQDLPLINRAKDALQDAGLLEALNYSFTSRSWLARFGMSSSVVLLNPLTEEHEVMVPSLLPGLVRNALDNWHHHFGSEPLPIRLFELRPTFHSGNGSGIRALSETETGVRERWKLAFILSGPRFCGGLRDQLGEVDFYDVKAMVEIFLTTLGVKGVRFSPLSEPHAASNPLFHPGQSIEILAGTGTGTGTGGEAEVAGVFGQMHPGKAREIKTRSRLWMGEIDWESIARLAKPALAPSIFKPWPLFPPMERDFALLMKSDISADKITQVALEAGKPLAKVAKIFDVYQGSPVAEGMTSVAVRVIFYDESRSLQEQETEAASTQILAAWKEELGAELRS